MFRELCRTRLHPVIQQSALRPVLLSIVGETPLYGAIVCQHGFKLGEERAAVVGDGRRDPRQQQRVGVPALEPRQHHIGRVMPRQAAPGPRHGAQLDHRPL